MLAFADPYQTYHTEIGPLTVFKLGDNKIRGQAKGITTETMGPPKIWCRVCARNPLGEARGEVSGGCFTHVCPYLSQSFTAFVTARSSSWRTVSHLNAHPSSRSTIHASTPGSKVILSQQWESHRDRKSTRLNSSHLRRSRMPSSA